MRQIGRWRLGMNLVRLDPDPFRLLASLLVIPALHTHWVTLVMLGHQMGYVALRTRL